MSDDAANDAGNDAAKKAANERRFHIAVENFIDLYKFIMVLAIGNCVRSLVQRQIQLSHGSQNELSMTLINASLYDWLMFAMVLVFIARFFLGDMAYWKDYTARNKQVQITDALNLLVNSFALTYLSFFIGYTHVLACLILAVLIAEVGWALLRLIEGHFRTTEGSLSPEVELGVLVSVFTIVLVLALALADVLPSNLPSGQPLTNGEKWWILGVLGLNNVLDLYVNGGRYLGAREGSWGAVRFEKRT